MSDDCIGEVYGSYRDRVGLVSVADTSGYRMGSVLESSCTNKKMSVLARACMQVVVGVYMRMRNARF